MPTAKSLIPLLYRALTERHGIAVPTNDIERCRQTLYRARREANDPSLANLSFQVSKSRGEVWIRKGDSDESSPAEH